MPAVTTRESLQLWTHSISRASFAFVVSAVSTLAFVPSPPWSGVSAQWFCNLTKGVSQSQVAGLHSSTGVCVHDFDSVRLHNDGPIRPFALIEQSSHDLQVLWGRDD